MTLVQLDAQSITWSSSPKDWDQLREAINLTSTVCCRLTALKFHDFSVGTDAACTNEGSRLC